MQRENYGTITDVKAEPLSDDFWSEPAALVESSGGEAVTADEMKGSVFEEGGSENIAADDMGEYSSEEEKVLILLFHRSMLIMEYLVMLKETGL